MNYARQKDKETKQLNIFLLVIGMLGMTIAINHTIYEKGQYMYTWLFVVMPYTLALVNRPKYRAYCWNAIKNVFLLLLPFVGLGVIMYILVAIASMLVGK